MIVMSASLDSPAEQKVVDAHRELFPGKLWWRLLWSKNPTLDLTPTQDAILQFYATRKLYLNLRLPLASWVGGRSKSGKLT